MDNIKRIKLLGLLLCALVVVGGALLLIFSAPATDTMAKPPEKEAQMLALINQARKEMGAAPLAWDERAAKVAVAKVAEMAKLDYFAHVSPKSGDLDKQFEKWGKLKLGENALGIGENLAQAQGYEDKELTPEFWHNGSMNSPEHRKNVLNAQFTHTGIAVKRASNGKVFMAQVFIMSMDAQQPVPTMDLSNKTPANSGMLPEAPMTTVNPMSEIPEPQASID